MGHMEIVVKEKTQTSNLFSREVVKTVKLFLVQRLLGQPMYGRPQLAFPKLEFKSLRCLKL